jgi:hypothetical protein
MYNKLQIILVWVIIALALSGCAYPQDKLAQNQTPYQDQVASVQSAIEKFQEEKGGILPIKTKEQDTPIYQKYLIDFKQLVPQYMAEAPSNAFESGGIFQYVLIDVETNPTVKIFDLRVAETIRDINLRISMQKYPPYKEQIAENVYTLDFEKLGFKEEPVVISPFTNQELSYIITGNAEVFVDYRKDLYQILQKTNQEFKPGEDIRRILTQDSMFVPAYSLSYILDPETNEPTFAMENS